MPRRTRGTPQQDNYIEVEDLEELFRERVVSLHLKNKYYEYANKSGETFNCPVCLNDLKQPEAFCLLACSHHVCFSCYYYMDKKICPICRS